MRPSAFPLLALTALAFLATASAAEAPKFQAEKDYKAVRTPQPTSDPSKIEVMEVFAYSCPHCYAFDPLLRAWVAKQPKDVNFVRLPHTLGAEPNVNRNKAFYAAQMLGVSEKFHAALFAGIHQDHESLSTPDELEALFSKKLGINAADFKGAYNSFAVDGGFRRSEGQIRDMAIASVPTLVVEGTYMVSPSSAGGFQRMLEVTDWLVEQARATRPAAKAAAAPAPAAAPAAPKKKKKSPPKAAAPEAAKTP